MGNDKTNITNLNFKNIINCVFHEKNSKFKFQIFNLEIIFLTNILTM